MRPTGKLLYRLDMHIANIDLTTDHNELRNLNAFSRKTSASLFCLVGAYTLFAIRDADLSSSMIRLLGSMTPARRGRYMSYFIGNGTYSLADFGKI